MRPLITAITAFLFVSGAYAQDAVDIEPVFNQEKHELKLNLGIGIQYDAIELNYEYLLDDHFTFGLGAYYAFKTEHNKVKYSLIPNVRFYPSKTKSASGLFVEANIAALTLSEYSFNHEANRGQYDDVIAGGMGGAVGYKFKTCGNFVFEGYLGAGKVMNVKSDHQIYPRMGLTVGKRF